MRLFQSTKSLCTYGIAVMLASSLLNPAVAQGLEQTKVGIAVGGQSSFYYLPLTIADRLGYFKDEGLNVEISDFSGGAKALQAVIGGSADVVSGAYEHVVDMQMKNQSFKAFVLQGRNPDLAIGVSKTTMPNYKVPADLKGKSIGVTAPGSSTHIILSHWLTKNGVKPSDVSIIGVGATAGAVAALRTGKIDAISNLDPSITILETAGDIKIVADGRTTEGAKALFGGSLPAGCLYATTDFVNKHPKTIQALTNAMVRALKWMQKATPEEVAATVPPQYVSGDKALYLQTFSKVRESYSLDGIIPESGTRTALQVLASFNPAVNPASVKLELTFDNRYAQAANQKYK